MWQVISIAHQLCPFFVSIAGICFDVTLRCKFLHYSRDYILQWVQNLSFINHEIFVINYAMINYTGFCENKWYLIIGRF